MPEMTLDPRRGYVALPLDVLELDLTPGAFRTLVEFCRMADREGWCWPSLAQLSDRLGRSRAAISGYVAELREGGLVETAQQKTANGFNYRLRFRVLFWAEWRARFAAPRARSSGLDTERRVKPAERLKEKENHIHENHSPADSAAGGDEDLSMTVKRWQECAGRAPYPAFDRVPAPELVEKTRSLLQSTPISSDIEPALAGFLEKRGITCSPERLAGMVAAAKGTDPQALKECLAKAWKPHWRRPPSDRHFAEIVSDARRREPAQTMHALLHSYYRRAIRTHAVLPQPHISATTSVNQAGNDPSYPRI